MLEFITSDSYSRYMSKDRATSLITERNTELRALIPEQCAQRDCKHLLTELAHAAQLGAPMDKAKEHEIFVCPGATRAKGFLGSKVCQGCVVRDDDERITQAVELGAVPFAASDLFHDRRTAKIQPLE